MKLLERSRRLNYILCGIIFAGVIIYTFVTTGNRDMLYYKASETGVVIQGPNDYSINIDYEDIADIELLSSFDRGIGAGGTEENNLYYGTFENELYGKYELFAIAGVRTHLCITTRDGQKYVLTRENNKDTENYYYAIKEKVPR